MRTPPTTIKLVVIAALIAGCGGDDEPSRPPKQPTPRALPAEAAPVVLPPVAAAVEATVGEAVAGKLSPLPRPLPRGAVGRLGSNELVHPGIEALSFGPDGKFLITSGGGKTRLWETSSGRLLAPPFVAERLLVNRDGSVAAATWPEKSDATKGYDDRLLNVWDPLTATSLRHERLDQRPESFEFVGDLLAIFHPRLILQRGQTRELAGFDLPISKTADGARSAGRAERDRHQLLVRDGPQEACRFFINRDSLSEYTIDISPDGQHVAYSETPASVDIYKVPQRYPDGSYRDVPTNYQPRYASLDRDVHTYSKAPAVARFTAGSDLLVVSSQDYPVTVFHVSEAIRHELPETAPALSALAISPDRKLLATATRGGRVRLWADDQADARIAWQRDQPAYLGYGGRETPKLPAALAELSPRLSPPGHNNPITTAIFSVDGELIVTGGDDGLRVWNARSLTPVRRIAVPGRFNDLAAAPLPDAIVVSLYIDGVAYSHGRMFNLRTGEEVTMLEAAPEPSNAAILHAVRSRVSQLARVVKQHRDGNRRIWMSEDAASAVISGIVGSGRSARAVLEIWDASAPQLRWQLDLSVTAAAFAHRTRQLAAGTSTGHLMLIDLDSGAVTHDVAAHAEAITALAYSADDTRLVSGSADTTALVWDPAQLESAASVQPEANP